MVLLSLVRLLSERPWCTKKEQPMIRGKHRSSTSKNNPEVPNQRNYIQFVLETAWTATAGAAGGHWLS